MKTPGDEAGVRLARVFEGFAEGERDDTGDELVGEFVEGGGRRQGVGGGAGRGGGASGVRRRACLRSSLSAWESIARGEVGRTCSASRGLYSDLIPQNRSIRRYASIGRYKAAGRSGELEVVGKSLRLLTSSS